MLLLLNLVSSTKKRTWKIIAHILHQFFDRLTFVVIFTFMLVNIETESENCNFLKYGRLGNKILTYIFVMKNVWMLYTIQLCCTQQSWTWLPMSSVIRQPCVPSRDVITHHYNSRELSAVGLCVREMDAAILCAISIASVLGKRKRRLRNRCIWTQEWIPHRKG